MHGAACKVQGGQPDLWRSGEVPQTHAHTAHPRRTKVRGGEKPTQGTVHGAQAREESCSWSVQSSSLLLQPRSHPLPIRDCMVLLLAVRWPHKGGRWSSVFGEKIGYVCVETLQEGTLGKMVTLAPK